MFYCFAIILKLEERDVSIEGKKVATSLRKELQDYFDNKVEDGDFKKLFLEYSDEEHNRIKEENSGCEIEHYMLLLGNQFGNDNDLSELRDDLYHEDMEYVKHNPKVDKEELDNDTKKERIPDTEFVLKLFAMKYQIRIAKVDVFYEGLMRNSAEQDANDYYIENGDDEGIQYYDLYIYNQDGTDATIYKRCQTLFDDDIMNECKYFVFTQPTYVPTFDGQNAFVDKNVIHHQLLAFSPDEEINANDDNKDDNEQEDDNAFENEIKITNFHCTAQNLCKHDKGAITEKCLTLTSRNINLCHVCNHYAHKKCTTRCKGSTKIEKSKGAKFICHLCKINEDGDRWPFVASKKFKDVVSDKAAQQLTVKALAFDSEENCKMTFQERMRRTKKNFDTGHFSMSEKKELVTTKTLFDDIDALYDPEYENNFERYKETCFKSWKWLETPEKRDEHVKIMKAKMNEHDCKVKKRCKKCAPIVTQLNKLQNAGFFNPPLKRTIPLNTKAIAKVKYIPPKLEYEYYYEEEKVFVKSGEPSNCKRISITSGLTYENARDNKCKKIKRV